MLDSTVVGTWLALVNGFCLFAVASIRKKRLDVADAALAGVAFVSSYNLFPSIVLLRFATDQRAWAALPPVLIGYEKYLALAAFLSLLFTLSSLASVYAKGWKRD
jgi:hypothetical protein